MNNNLSPSEMPIMQQYIEDTLTELQRVKSDGIDPGRIAAMSLIELCQHANRSREHIREIFSALKTIDRSLRILSADKQLHKDDWQ